MSTTLTVKAAGVSATETFDNVYAAKIALNLWMRVWGYFPTATRAGDDNRVYDHTMGVKRCIGTWSIQ